MISVKLEPKEFKEYNGKMVATWDLRLKEWEWASEWVDNKLSFLTATYGGKVRYSYVSGAAAPTPQDYTPEQLASFKMFVANDDGWGLMHFFNEVGETVRDALFNSAPKGEKTALKDRCRTLVGAASTERKGYVMGIQEALENKSTSALTELMNELDATQLILVDQALTEIERLQILNLMESSL